MEERESEIRKEGERTDVGYVEDATIINEQL